MITNGSRRVTARTSVAAVIGHPVTQSLSPVIHNVGFASTNVDWTYVAIDVPISGLDDFMRAFRTSSLAALSVTMPHKQAVAEHMDRIDPVASSLRSVNTVVKSDEGELHGHSTDGDGMCDGLEALDIDVTGSSILLLGAGGAARSIAEALVRRSARSVAVFNRTSETAEKMLEIAPGVMKVASVGNLESTAADVDIIINATSVGMGTAESPLSGIVLRSGRVVVDIVYHPLETALLAQARRAGCRVVDGLNMLVHQAVRQQILWTGVAPDARAMIEAAKQALA